jgi:hypothetical protein
MRTVFTGLLFCWILLALLSCESQAAGATVVPLPKAHAHNDYRHERPLFDALDHGFCSVEADIYLVGDDLLVAHDPRELKTDRTLRSLYLEPLRKRILAKEGKVYRKGPLVTLLIDIKTAATPTYEALDKMLAEYSDILTSFGPKGRKDKAVIVIVSGNRPRELMALQKVRYAFYDGRLSDLDCDDSAELIPLISDNWNSHFTWRGNGPMSLEESRKLRDIVEKAHAKGRRIRFWSTPDKPSANREALWTELHEAGVDLLNTDDLSGLKNFLIADRNK